MKNNIKFHHVSKALSYAVAIQNSFVIIFSTPQYNPVAYFVDEMAFEEYFNQDEGWTEECIASVRKLSNGELYRRDENCIVIKF